MEPPAPSRRDAINRLLHAMALRELALAGLLNAEADKMAQVAESGHRPGSFEDVLTFQRTITDLLHALVRKEEVLVRKLNLIEQLCAEEVTEQSEGEV